MKSEIMEMIETLKDQKENFNKAAELQLTLWKGEKPAKQPLLLHCTMDSTRSCSVPQYNYKEAYYDSEKMLSNELTRAVTAANGRMEAVPSVRANMGCGIFSTLFGIKQEIFEDKMPWVLEHLPKDKLVKMEVEDLKISDDFKLGLEHMAFMSEALNGTGCMIYPMDLQGAFDTAHIVYGDQIFYDLYDDPEFAHHLLELSCQAIFLGMAECLKTIPESHIRIAHYNNLVIPRSMGGIKISEDTSTLLSKTHIEEFVIPYMHSILEHFGGGYVHYCGRNQHLFEAVLNEPLAYGLNFGNTDMHDMLHVLEECAAHEKIYYGSMEKSEEEPLEDYFLKRLRASRKGGRSLLLLQYACNCNERSTVAEAWDRALEAEWS